MSDMKEALPGQLTKNIRLDIIRLITEEPGEHTTEGLAEMFELKPKQVYALAKRNKIYNKLAKKDRKHKYLSHIVQNSIKDLLKKHKYHHPFKRIRNGVVEYCGNWDDLQVMLDADRPVKFIHKMEPDIFKDDIETFVPIIAVMEV